MITVHNFMKMQSRDNNRAATGHLQNSRVCALASGGKAGLDYFVYLPQANRINGEVMVTVHGIGRNAAEHAYRFAPLAEEMGFCLIAPHFTRSRHHHFQSMARGSDGDLPDESFLEVLDDFTARTGLPTDRVKLFGYSGGGQFSHRFTMVHPERIERLAIMAAGWFTMPDTTLPYPYGMGPSEAMEGRQFNPANILSVPTKVFVGSRDEKRDSSLNRKKIIDQSQGKTRIERATNWVNTINRLYSDDAKKHQIELKLLRGMGHSFTRNMDKCNLGTHIVDWLFPINQRRTGT